MLKKVFILLIAASTSLTSNLLSQDVLQRIDDLVSDYSNCGEFSGVVLVSRGGKIIYNKAFGLADREWKTPMTTDTRFRIASLSKPFTALAVLQLVQEGRIRLDGTITDYIPDYAGRAGDSITIHQLLSHTSGLKSSMEPEEEYDRQRIHHDFRELLKYPETSELLFKPGTGFSYSNFGYNILAYIIQEVSGKPFSNELEERIFKPSGMTGTCQYENDIVTERLARGYEYKLLYGFKNADYVDASLTYGAGGLISTSYDLYLFDRALRSENLLNNELMNSMFRSSSSGGYGYGWFIGKRSRAASRDSITIADHTGSIDGFGSYMARILNDSSLVVVLKNHRSDTYIDPAYAPEIGREIISVIYDDKVIRHKESIAHKIAPIIIRDGIERAVSEYNNILKNQADNFNMTEPELNKLGIELFFRFGMIDEALRVFELNMLHYPRSYNTYDSYAYILMKKGDYRNSVKFYKEGLDILKKYPKENDSQTVRDDSRIAIKNIEEMETKIRSGLK